MKKKKKNIILTFFFINKISCKKKTFELLVVDFI